MTTDSGTVDITNTVEAIRSTFVTWATATIYAAELAYAPLAAVVSLPILSDLDKALIKKTLDFLSNDAVMLAFFENTVLRKADQAKDFVMAVEAVRALPSNVSKDDYAKAEAFQITTFRNFVCLTN